VCNSEAEGFSCAALSRQSASGYSTVLESMNNCRRSASLVARRPFDVPSIASILFHLAVFCGGDLIADERAARMQTATADVSENIFGAN